MDVPDKMTIRTVLFDLYDTLVEIDINDYIKAKAAIALRAGVRDIDFINSWKKNTGPSARGEIRSVNERITLALADLGKNISEELAHELSKIEIDLQENKVRKLPGCDFTLKNLKGMGIKLGLVTNISSVSRNVLSLLGIDDMFDYTVYSYQVGMLKPEKAIYELASSKLGVGSHETMFVGDGNDQELDGAKNAGMLAVKVGAGRADLVKGVQSSLFDYEIKTLPELIPLIKSLNT